MTCSQVVSERHRGVSSDDISLIAVLGLHSSRYTKVIRHRLGRHVLKKLSYALWLTPLLRIFGGRMIFPVQLLIQPSFTLLCGRQFIES
jgi:hypothetical protein